MAHGRAGAHRVLPGLRRAETMRPVKDSISGPDSPAWLELTQAFSRRVPDADGTLAASVVVVAVFDLDDWQDFLAQAAAMIDAEESARAARQRNPDNRDALVLTYALHRLLLSRLLGCPPDRVAIHRDAKGCPRLRDDALHTSLSHAGRRVAFAATGTGPVGIDIEPDVRARDLPELAERVAHPDEMRQLAELPAQACGALLLELWVRKEALLKAAGIGLEHEMDTFVAPEGVALRLPGDTFPGQFVALRRVDCGAGWTMALAARPGVHARLVGGGHAG